MITTVLFDLDATLLPMDNDEFIKVYFGLLAKKLIPYGYEQDSLVKAVWTGTEGMVRNDGTCTNEEAFWNTFKNTLGEKCLQDKPIFDQFYCNEFNQARVVCQDNPLTRKAVETIKRKELRVVLATNPLFPAIATEARIRWAGFEPEEFEHYTTYENSHYCKPNPKYYLEVLDHIGCRPEECLMVGNDVIEDIEAGQAAGLDVFLITDHIINRKNTDISIYKHGSFEDFISYIDS